MARIGNYWLRSSLLWCALFHAADCCNVVHLMSKSMGSMAFSLQKDGVVLQTRRPIYASTDDEGRELYLYHVMSSPHSDGNGRWVVNDELDSETSAIAFIDSWAIQPYLIQALHDKDKSRWMVSNEGKWESDPSFLVTCGDLASSRLVSSFHFASSVVAPQLSGYFTEVSSSVFVHSSDELYFYRLSTEDGGGMWVMSNIFGSLQGQALVMSDAYSPAAIRSDSDWMFAQNGTWIKHNARLTFGNRITDLYLKHTKGQRIMYLPDGLEFYTLRNSLPMPALGLGTDGLAHPSQSIMRALRRNYRMLDLTDIGNIAPTVGRIFLSHYRDHSFPLRVDTFVIVKIWPTSLGFEPFISSFGKVLSDLQASYVDLLMLNYPMCNHDVDWMGCDRQVLPGAGWRESYRALEKEYAEGRALSIGVSNFNLHQLQELLEFAQIVPHVVQNFAQPGNIDTEIIKFCADHDIQFMAYSTLIGYSELSPEIKTAIQTAAAVHRKPPESIILRSFTQNNVAVIPRSDDVVHMLTNQNIFSWDLTSEELHSLG